MQRWSKSEKLALSLALFAVAVELDLMRNHGESVRFILMRSIRRMKVACGHMQGAMLQRDPLMAFQTDGIMNVTGVL